MKAAVQKILSKLTFGLRYFSEPQEPQPKQYKIVRQWQLETSRGRKAFAREIFHRLTVGYVENQETIDERARVAKLEQYLNQSVVLHRDLAHVFLRVCVDSPCMSKFKEDFQLVDVVGRALCNAFWYGSELDNMGSIFSDENQRMQGFLECLKRDYIEELQEFCPTDTDLLDIKEELLRDMSVLNTTRLMLDTFEKALLKADAERWRQEMREQEEPPIMA